MPKVTELYFRLLERFGSQGWFPLLEQHELNWKCVYHPGDYSYPHSEEQKLEICLGAILTQNTNWQNTVKALINLKKNGYLNLSSLSEIALPELAELIIPSGYYNQKARKIKEFTKLMQQLEGRSPEREELLGVWGIGPETADSILLYACNVPVMVIDNYTYRVFDAEGINAKDVKYETLRSICEQELPKDYKVLQEFHALLVKAGKQLNN